MKARLRSFPSIGGDTASVLHRTGVDVRPRLRSTPTTTLALPPPKAVAALSSDTVRLLHGKVGNRAIASVLSSGSARRPVVQRVFEHNGQLFDEETMTVDSLEAKVGALRTRLDIEQKAYDDAFWTGGDVDAPVLLKRLVERLEAKLEERRREVAKPETAEKGQPPTKKPDKYFGRIPEEAQRSDLVAMLVKWEQSAGLLYQEVIRTLQPIEPQRKALGNAYYEGSGAAFRTEYKKLRRQATHLKWATSLAGSVGRALDEGEVPLEAFRVVGAGSEVQAVMQLRHDEDSGRVDPGHIEVIVGNPENIVGGGGGVMKPLIAVAILGSLGSPIHLLAATNKVKGIYDHYGFRVVASNPERHVERPERHIKAPKVDYPHGYYGGEVLGPLVPRKTTWHQEGSMVLTPEAAVQFMQKYPVEDVLDAKSIEFLTARLKPVLQEGTGENLSVDLVVGERS